MRINDNVAIPIGYPAVPMKLEGLSPHRLVARFSDPRPARDSRNGWDDVPYNPPCRQGPPLSPMCNVAVFCMCMAISCDEKFRRNKSDFILG